MRSVHAIPRTALVVEALHKPGIPPYVAKDSVQAHAVRKLHSNVPFFTAPFFTLPPIARRPPWTTGTDNLRRHFRKRDMDWLAGPATDICWQRRTKHAHRHGRGGDVVFSPRSLAIAWSKSSHSEIVRLMRGQHFRRANSPSAL